MDMNKMVELLKKHPDFSEMGMIASHLGVVRGTSLNGQKVKGIEIQYDHDKISDILSDIKKMPGIFEIMVDTSEGLLEVGEDVMAVVVGGDIREHVFPALIGAVNRIKAEAAKKKELF
jgi:molybdopterin synthase catalytic subunit